jgi:hypothetical protein
LHQAEQTADEAGAPEPDAPKVKRVNLLAVAGGVKLPPVEAPDGPEEQLDLSFKLAHESPAVAIIIAWIAVEQALYDVARRAKLPWFETVSGKERPMADVLARRLASERIIPAMYAKIISDLAGVRNRAAHRFTIPQDNAEDFVQLAKRVVSVLQRPLDELRKS